MRMKRNALGLSQMELAKLLGVYQRTISEWESGHVVIRHPMILYRALLHIAEERGVGLREFLKDEHRTD